MCYSARIWADYRKYTKAYGVDITIKDFVELFWRRLHIDAKIKTPKALAATFRSLISVFSSPDLEVCKLIAVLRERWDV